MTSVEEIESNFSYLDEWDDRYRYLIELGRTLDPLPDALHDDAHKVRGCASQVWLETRVDGQVMRFRGDSDAHIVRGLVALVLAFYSGRSPTDALGADAFDLFARLGLSDHLTPQRSNGVRAMVDRIRTDARAAL